MGNFVKIILQYIYIYIYVFQTEKITQFDVTFFTLQLFLTIILQDMFIFNTDLIDTINLANFSDWEKTKLVIFKQEEENQYIPSYKSKPILTDV